MFPELGRFEMTPIEMSDGDVLLMLTDGILEAEDSAGIPFGAQRALDVVRSNSHRAAAEIVDILHKTVVEHCASRLQDDITSIIVKVRPEPPIKNRD
jgi:serine phosphatase RsbU (regulator of sigma subunit)